jgi:hypothetical protein
MCSHIQGGGSSVADVTVSRVLMLSANLSTLNELLLISNTALLPIIPDVLVVELTVVILVLFEEAIVCVIEWI